jgi:hypothetical protein
MNHRTIRILSIFSTGGLIFSGVLFFALMFIIQVVIPHFTDEEFVGRFAERNPIVLVLAALFFVFGMILVAFFILIQVYIISRKSSERKGNLQKLARDLNAVFLPNYNLPLLNQFASAFGFGETDSVWEVKQKHPLTGLTSNFISTQIQGRDVAFFNQTHYRGALVNRQGRKAVSQTFFLFKVHEAKFPLFCLQPIKLKNNLKPIDNIFQIDQNSPYRFFLYGESEHAVRKTFTPQVVNFFSSHPGLTTFASGQYILFYQHGQLIEPDQIMAFLNLFLNFINSMPKR